LSLKQEDLRVRITYLASGRPGGTKGSLGTRNTAGIGLRAAGGKRDGDQRA
jgi:hypothetical protein